MEGYPFALTPRIEGILSVLDAEDQMCEIGADQAPFAIGFALRFAKGCWASEYGAGPFEALRKSVASRGMESRIHIYRGNGLEHLPPEVDTAVICGMGGLTIAGILESLDDHPTLRKLVLEPQSEPEKVRRLILEKGWTLQKDFYVPERGRAYPVLVAFKGSLPEEPYSDDELIYGRLPLKAKDPVLRDSLRRALQSLGKAGDNSKALAKAEKIKTVLSLLD